MRAPASGNGTSSFLWRTFLPQLVVSKVWEGATPPTELRVGMWPWPANSALHPLAPVIGSQVEWGQGVMLGVLPET